MVTQDAIQKAMAKNNDHVVAEEVDEYPEKLQRAASSQDVPEWVRRAAQRILSLSERKGIPVDHVSYEDVGLGLHDNIIEAAIIGCESERFYKIVMNFEQAIIRMRGV